MKLLTTLCATLFIAVSFAQTTYSVTDSVIVTSENLGVTDWGRGFDFTPTSNLYLTDLGKRVPETGTYYWKIWETGTQTLIHSQTSLDVSTTTTYTYEPISAPVVLTAGVQYSLILYSVNSGYYYGTSTQVNSNVTYGGNMRYCNGCGTTQTFPTDLLGNYHYGTPDFLFTLVPPCDTYATLSDTICDSESYTSPSGNYTWNTTGSYADTIPNAAGCDSLLTINLTVNQTTFNTLVATACDSYTSPSGNIWTASGLYYDTIANSNGCDSILTIDLIINNSYTNTDVVTTCDSSYMWNGMTYSSSGIYTDSLVGTNGCDSLLMLDLTLTNVDASTSVSGITISANATGASYQWVDCDSSFAAIPGQTGQTFTPTANGNYAVIVTENNCSDTSACVPITSVGIEVVEAEFGVNIYPNPTTGLFTLELNNLNERASIEVVNVLGKVIYRKETSENQLQIDLGDHGRGIYFVDVKVGSNNMTKRVVLK